MEGTSPAGCRREHLNTGKTGRHVHDTSVPMCFVRSQPMGGHREVELLPQAGGGATAGHSLIADLHQRRATQPHDSTVSPSSDLSEE